MFFTQKDNELGLPNSLIEEARLSGSSAYSGWEIRKDGSMFWIDSVFTAHYDDENNVTGFTKVAHDHTEYKKQIEFEQSNLDTLINNISGAMWSVNTDYEVTTANKAFDAMVIQMSGHSIKRGTNVFGSGFQPDQISKFKGFYDRAFAGEAFSVIDHLDDPFERWSEISFEPIAYRNLIIGVACYSHDITHTKLTEAKLTQANRLFEFICQVNHTIIHAENEQILFDNICRIAVKLSKFKVTWIGIIDSVCKKISLVAQYGFDPETAAIFSNVDYEPNGPIDHLLRENDYYVCNDIQRDLGISSWKGFASAHGFQSNIALPIKKSGKTIGALSIYAEQLNYFNAEEIALLDSAVKEISYALDFFEKERDKKNAEEKIKSSEHRFRSLIENSSDALAIFSGEGKLQYVSPSAEPILGYTEAELMQMDLSTIVHPDNIAGRVQLLKNVLDSAGTPVGGYAKQMRHKDGRWRWIESTMINLLHDPDIKGIVDNFRDVTERKQAEEKLKHSELRLKQAQEIAHFGNWELDLSTMMFYWSEEACRIYGLAPDNNIHSFDAWLAFIHPDDLAGVMKIVEAGLKTFINNSFYYRIIRKDSSIRYIYTIAHFEFNDGVPVSIFGASHDVTEIKLAENKLKFSELRLMQAQEIAHFGNWELDFSTGIALWSDEACRIYGLAPEDNKQTYQTWISFIHPHDFDDVMNVIKKGETTLSNVSFCHRIVRRDGTVRHIHSFANYEFNEAGEPLGLHGVVHDITDISEAEKKLKAGNLRLKKAQEIANYGGYEVDLTTDTAMWSEQFCKIYGLSPNDNIHDYASWLSFVHPKDVERIDKIIQQSNATHTNVNFYYRIIRRDGTTRNIHSYRQIEFDSHNKAIGAYAVAHDITDETDHIMQLKAQNEQLQQIAWVQSHKVRGPLATILGLAQLFNSKDGDIETEEIIHGILTSAEKLDAVIREIVSKTSESEITETDFVNLE